MYFKDTRYILQQFVCSSNKTESIYIFVVYYQNYYNILTSDPAELSNKKYTCVNNRCIQSKISGDNLDCERVELGADVTLTEAGEYQTII